MAAGAFLTIEVVDLKTPLTSFTTRHPDCVVDLAIESVPVRGSTVRAMNAYCKASGVPAAQMDEFVALAQGNYDAVRTIGRDDAKGLWFGSFGIPLEQLTDPTAVQLGRFLDEQRVALRWVRSQQGVAFVRAQVPAGVDPQILANRCKRHLDSLHIDADVAVESVSPDEMEPWLRLVQGASGTLARTPSRTTPNIRASAGSGMHEAESPEGLATRLG